MNKVAHYLQEHLVGEVTTASDARQYFSTDTSIFTLTPSLVVYPRNENDIRKAARFTWQLAERGRIIPMTARGAGTDQSGAAIGSGMVLVFPAHLNRILELDDKSGVVVLEPGTNYGRLQQTLHTHGRFLPPYPSSLEYSTVGGAVSNNASGEKSIKYGTTGDYVQGLRVVLANGEIIQTERLAKRELNKKLGLSTFEGEIYRSLDKLFEEHEALIEKNRPVLKGATAGYNIWDVRNKDGSFDLTPLFVGSQGTLGILTEVALSTEEYNPSTVLIGAFFSDVKSASAAAVELTKLPYGPSMLEIIDGHVFDYVNKQNPNFLRGIFEKTPPRAALIVEFDGSERLQKKVVKKVKKILERHTATYRIETENEGKDQLLKIRRSTSLMLTSGETRTRALPVIEDSIVPIDHLGECIEKTTEILEKHHLPIAIWGHAGTGSLRIYPSLDLSQVGDRQKLFRVMDEYYELILSLGGTTSGEHNDGRLRGAYVQKVYGDDIFGLFKKVKQIFDPYGILNPGVKIDATFEQARSLVRQDYSLQHLHEHLPRA